MTTERHNRYEDQVRWRKNNPIKHMVIRARCRARDKGIEFSITHEDVEKLTHCPVFGTELNYEPQPSAFSHNAASLDRIDNSKGYVPGNVTIMSLRANTLKRDASVEEIEKLLEWMRRQG
jgi:hypothetical protein